jgi:outer membrane protein OmpA-like peptidoglycan-associated protein
MSQSWVAKSAGFRLLATLLGLGSLDLAILNVVVLPNVLEGDAQSSEAAWLKLSAHTGAQTTLSAARALDEPETSVRAKTVEMPAPAVPRRARSPAFVTESAQVVAIPFEQASARVGSAGRQAIAEASALWQRQGGVIEIVGHADSPGTRAYNQHLSERRARAVVALLRRALGRHVVGRARLVARAVGEDEPSSDGRDRRVDIHIGGAP